VAHQRLLSTQIYMPRRARVQWNIQLPLCNTCYQMYDLLYHYLPSRHGPPERRRQNRWAALAMVILFLAGILNLLVVGRLFPAYTDLSKFIVLVVLGALLAGVYYWNDRASQRARNGMYRDLVDRAGYEFRNAEIRSIEPHRSVLPIKRETPRVILTFENEKFGQDFEEANPGLVEASSPDGAGP
jgi:hypothetical protein